MIRPAGRPYPALGVIHCLAECYAQAGIAALMANMDATGRQRKDRAPESIGDCIVETRMGNRTEWRVHLGANEYPATGLQHALDIVAVVRSIERQPEAA